MVPVMAAGSLEVRSGSPQPQIEQASAGAAERVPSRTSARRMDPAQRLIGTARGIVLILDMVVFHFVSRDASWTERDEKRGGG
jgi:hypothetical protein